MEGILNTFDSEWDRLVGRVPLGINRSRKELKHLGIDEEDAAKKNTEKVTHTVYTAVLYNFIRKIHFLLYRC